MRNRLTIALICIAIPTPALAPPDQVFDARKGQVLVSPVTNYQKAQAERLRQEQIRLENERIRQEIKREARNREQERTRLQREERERERARTESVRRQETEANRNADSGMYEQLRMIGQLRDDGVLTNEEFQAQKEKILQKQESEDVATGSYQKSAVR